MIHASVSVLLHQIFWVFSKIIQIKELIFSCCGSMLWMHLVGRSVCKSCILNTSVHYPEKAATTTFYFLKWSFWIIKDLLLVASLCDKILHRKAAVAAFLVWLAARAANTGMLTVVCLSAAGRGWWLRPGRDHGARSGTPGTGLHQPAVMRSPVMRTPPH